MRSSTERARPSIHGRQRLTTARALAGGAWPVSFSRTRSASASGSGASERSVDLGEAAPLVALLHAGGEIGGDALHALGADGLDPRLLDRLEHGARLAAGRRERLMQGRVVTGDGRARRRRHGRGSPRSRSWSGCATARAAAPSCRTSPGGSLVNTTSTALSAAIERVVCVTARLKGSSGASLRRASVIVSSRPRWRSTAAGPRRSSADRTRRSGRARARRIC